MLSREDVEKVVRRTTDLPTLPSVHRRLGELLESPWTSMADIAAVVREDQVLTARVLLRANSASYALPERVESVEAAVALMGHEALRKLVRNTRVMPLHRDGQPVGSFSTEAFWRHCLGVAVVAREIAAHLEDGPDPELAFTAGLVHDLGKLVFMDHYPVRFYGAVALARREGIPLLEAEERQLGFTHPRAGRMLARRWNMPEEQQEAIAFHHDPARAERQPQLVACVHLADCIATALHLGHGGDGCVPVPSPAARELCPFPVAAVEGLVGRVRRRFEDSLLVLGFWDEEESRASRPVRPVGPPLA